MLSFNSLALNQRSCDYVSICVYIRSLICKQDNTLDPSQLRRPLHRAINSIRPLNHIISVTQDISQAAKRYCSL